MWTGFYAGLNIGGGWSANSVNPNGWAPYLSPATGIITFAPGNFSGGSNAGGVVGGGQIGYNYQFGPSFLVGVETDFQGTSMSSGGNNNYILYPDPFVAGAFLTPLTPGGNAGVSLNWFGTVRGRVGYLFTPTLLVYGTGGFAYGGGSSNRDFWFGDVSGTRTGWTAGGGVEWMFWPNWSAKVEYLYYDLGSVTMNSVSIEPGALIIPAWGYVVQTQKRFDGNMVRAGLNYHFNWGAPAPVVAKY
jgi:outer membrane immunogenic protein